MERKKVVVYGNCHTEAVIKYLQSNKEFIQKYEILPILPVYQIENSEYFNLPVFKECDIFIHQSIRENNRYGREYASKNLISKLKDGCKVIAIPNLYHLPICFFPQYTEEREFKLMKGATIFFRDSIIDSGVKNGYSIKQIYDEYKKSYYFSKERIQKALEEFILKVQEREQEWDIKISGFLMEKYKDEQLFFDPNHPTPVVISYISEELLKCLGIKNYTDLGDYQPWRMDTYEMPICESVRRALNLSYQTAEIRNTGNKLIQDSMYLRSYIIQYMACMWQEEALPFKCRVRSKVLYAGTIIYNSIWIRLKRITKKMLKNVKRKDK